MTGRIYDWTKSVDHRIADREKGKTRNLIHASSIKHDHIGTLIFVKFRRICTLNLCGIDKIACHMHSP